MIAGLPHDRRGRPIPWFVHVDENGDPDFRVVRRGGIRDALNKSLCWVCGLPRGREAAFVIGPMCAVNRIAPEPPAHRECAQYSANACPFLTTPGMRRRTTGLPEDRHYADGAILRNPGIALVWFTNHWETITSPGGYLLFRLGPPTRVQWRREGRAATRAEVLDALTSGYPLLREAAEQDGPDAVDMLEHDRNVAMTLLPAA